MNITNDKIMVNKNYPIPDGYKTLDIKGNIRYLIKEKGEE